jgi:hypothetical protein
MGYNTTVVIMNDALEDIRKDPNFGENLVQAVLESVRYRTTELDDRGFHHIVDIPAGNHANAGHVVESHHADGTHLVQVGGNLGQSILYTWGWNIKPEELLKRLADKHGYRLVKKTERKQGES